jgi:hypothetical protein
MRRTASAVLLLMGAFVILVSSSTLVSMKSPRQSALPGQDDKTQEKNDFENRFPLANYDAAEPMDARERAKRKHKDQRVAKGRLDEMQGVTETQIVDGKRLAALPVNLSDLIIVGDVLNGYAYLSSNKTGLFSEFAVSIVDVLKGMRGDTVKPGTRISIEREGGSIRYPSGRIRWVRYAHEGMPSIGRRYAFFLRRSGQDKIFTILTGYELRAGLVTPIDGVGSFEERKLPQFAPYDGFAESAFLITVRGLIK